MRRLLAQHVSTGALPLWGVPTSRTTWASSQVVFGMTGGLLSRPILRRALMSVTVLSQASPIRPLVVFRHTMMPASIIGKHSHCPMLSPRLSKPKKLSGSRVNSTVKRASP